MSHDKPLTEREALLLIRGYNVDIAAGRINYRPEDHIAVVDRALSIGTAVEDRTLAELLKIRDLCIQALMRATGESREAIEDAPMTCAVRHAEEVAVIAGQRDWAFKQLRASTPPSAGTSLTPEAVTAIKVAVHDWREGHIDSLDAIRDVAKALKTVASTGTSR